MGVKLSLAHLTALTTPPPQLVALAAAAGYDMVSLRLAAVTAGDAFPIISDETMMRETLARLADTGLGVLDVEVARLTPQVDLDSFKPMLETAERLGAAHVLTQAHDPDLTRVTDTYARFCDQAAAHGLTADIEFLTWTPMGTLDAAAALAMSVERPNAGVVIDTLHFSRSNCDPAAISALPPALFRFLQISDAPREALRWFLAAAEQGHADAQARAFSAKAWSLPARSRRSARMSFR